MYFLGGVSLLSLRRKRTDAPRRRSHTGVGERKESSSCFQGPELWFRQGRKSIKEEKVSSARKSLRLTRKSSQRAGPSITVPNQCGQLEELCKSYLKRRECPEFFCKKGGSGQATTETVTGDFRKKKKEEESLLRHRQGLPRRAVRVRARRGVVFAKIARKEQRGESSFGGKKEERPLPASGTVSTSNKKEKKNGKTSQKGIYQILQRGALSSAAGKPRSRAEGEK